MTDPLHNLPTVLAETDWYQLVNLVFLVVVVLLSLIGVLAKKWKERQLLQQEKRRQQNQAYGAGSDDHAEDDEGGWIEVPPPAQPRRPLRPAPHPVQRKPMEPDWDEEPTPVPPPAPRQAQPLHSAEQDLADLIAKHRLRQSPEKEASEYLRARRTKQRKRQMIEDGHEHQTLHALGSPTTRGGYSDAGVDQPRPNQVRLDAQALRQAILYHEILGPPKALRDNPDPWDG